jgi:hypothetical protein
VIDYKDKKAFYNKTNKPTHGRLYCCPSHYPDTCLPSVPALLLEASWLSRTSIGASTRPCARCLVRLVACSYRISAPSDGNPRRRRSGLRSQDSAGENGVLVLDGVPTHILLPGAVLLALLLWFLVWFLIRGLFHWSRLRRIQSQIRGLPPTSQREDFRKIFAKDKRLSHLWKQYQNSLHVQTEDRDGQSVIVAIRSTIPAEAYFNSQFVVDSRLTTEFFKHLPGIFTGIGCPRRLNFEPPCRLNIEPGRDAVGCFSVCG